MSQRNLASDRRQFIKLAGAASAISMFTVPRVFGQAGSEHRIQLALIGTGGRGTGAVVDALTASKYPIKLVAMADLFQHRLDESHAALTERFKDKSELISVPADRQFVGFDAYKKAMDVLRPGDIAIFASPLAFRWVHFQYAIERGLNVFMEKPLVADGPSAKRMLELAKKADERNLKCAVGLMIRHCRGRQELHKRISDGEIGDLVCMRARRMHGPIGPCFSTRKPKDRDELRWQVERYYSFLWASGGLFTDYYIHQIDEVSWMKNAWPVKALAVGGRHFRGEYIDQNFDSYAVEYTYPDGAKLFFEGRTMIGCQNDMSSVVYGTKGSAIVSTSSHFPGKVRTFKSLQQDRESTTWAFPQPEESPYALEWKDLLHAIAHDEKYNEVPRSIQANVVTNMGRMAAHIGQEVTYEQMFNCPHEMSPDTASFVINGPAPVTPDSEGKYPLPTPGVSRDREYGKTDQTKAEKS